MLILHFLGATFKRYGAVTMSMFRRGKITPNFDLIVDCVDKLLNLWRAQPKDHVHTDITIQSENLLLQIFGHIAFDFDLDALNSSHGRNELNQALTDYLSSINIVFYAPSFIARTYLALNSRYQRARKTMDQYIRRMIEQELNETEESRAKRKRTSLIASLVSSLQQQEEESDENRKGMTIERKYFDEILGNIIGLSRAEILDNMITFLIAGFETTSSALSWFIYAMSKNPRVQQKIKAELKEKLGQNELSLEQLDSLVYLDCVLNEIFRVYPPAAGVSRVLLEDDQLPATGIKLRKGDDILIPLSALARDSRLWKVDPEMFYPERFLNEDKDHAAIALIPFGGGHRQCLGRDLAQFEFKVMAARLMQRVTFSDGGPKLNSGGYENGLTVKPKVVGVTIAFD